MPIPVSSPVSSTFPGPPIDYPTSAQLPLPFSTYLPSAIDLHPSTPLPGVDTDIPSSLDDDFYSNHTYPFTAPFDDVYHLDDNNMMCDYMAKARPTHISHDKHLHPNQNPLLFPQDLRHPQQKWQKKNLWE